MSVQEWVHKAEQDYKAIQDLLIAQEPVWDAIGFHAQQCAEKYFKAYLLFKKQTIPKTHDLEILYQLCCLLNPDWKQLESFDLDFLTMGAVESRYPGVSLTQSHCEDMFEILYPLRHLSRKLLNLPVL